MKNEWKTVKDDGFPKEGDRVLAYVQPMGGGLAFQYVLNYSINIRNVGYWPCVTHWQLTPEDPE